MKNFGNFGTSLGQGIPGGTVINPYFDFWGGFTAQQIQGVNGMVAYYPASPDGKEHHKKYRQSMGSPRRGFVQGTIGQIVGSPKAMSR